MIVPLCYLKFFLYEDFSGSSDSKESACNAADLDLILGSGRFPWSWKWLPTLPGESHEQRSLASYSPWGHEELDMAERIALSLSWKTWGCRPLLFLGFPSGSVVKTLSAMQEMQVQSLGQEDPLEKGLATHSSILAWRIPRAEEPGGLQSMESQRVGHNWMTDTFTLSLHSLSDKTPQNLAGLGEGLSE